SLESQLSESTLKTNELEAETKRIKQQLTLQTKHMDWQKQEIESKTNEILEARKLFAGTRVNLQNDVYQLSSKVESLEIQLQDAQVQTRSLEARLLDKSQALEESKTALSLMENDREREIETHNRL